MIESPGASCMAILPNAHNRVCGAAARCVVTRGMTKPRLACDRHFRDDLAVYDQGMPLDYEALPDTVLNLLIDHELRHAMLLRREVMALSHSAADSDARARIAAATLEARQRQRIKNTKEEQGHATHTAGTSAD